LKAKVSTDDVLEGNNRVVTDSKKEDERMAEIISFHGRHTIGGILESESGDIF